MVETLFPSSSNWCLSKIMSTREDGSVAYGSQNNVFVLKVSDGQIYPFIIIDAHKDKVTSVVFSPRGKYDESQNFVLSSGDDGYVKIWNIQSQKPVICHNSHSVQKELSKVVCASWSPCNVQYVVSAGENETLVLWNTFNNTTTRFFFPKLKPAVIEMSYHNEKILGVGTKSGLVYIVKLVGKGEIMHKLRGHDKEVQSLSWNPISHVDGECDISETCLLASSSQEKEIFIWQGETGECMAKLHLPKISFVKGESLYGKWDVVPTFIPLFWASPNRLYSSTKSGELICCNPTLIIESSKKDYTQKNKKKTSDWKLVHAYHSHAILAIAGVPVKVQLEDFIERDGEGWDMEMFEQPGKVSLPVQNLIWTVGKDQKLVAIRGDSPTSNAVFSLNTINGHAFVIGVSPFDPTLVAIGAGDGKIRLWHVSKQSGKARVFAQKINDRVYSVAWHPYNESILAFGTSEGRVGIIDIHSQKPPTLFMTKHGGKVYAIAWGPIFPGFKTKCDEKSFSFYSAGGGKLFWHNPANLHSECVVITSDIPCKKIVDLSWKPDFKVLAVGSKKGHIYILKPPIFEVICSVLATTKCVMSLTWHPLTISLEVDCSNFHGYLTFASVDNENIIKVYNYTESSHSSKMEQASVLKGHSGYIQSVSWNPHIGGRLISCSADFSIRLWDVTTCTQLAKLIASQSVLPLFCLWSPIDPDIVIAGYTERVVISWKLSAFEEEPVLRVLKVEKGNHIPLSELVNGSEVCPIEKNKDFEESIHSLTSDINHLTLAKRNEDQKHLKENKMFAKVWTPVTDPFQSCYELLKTEGPETFPGYKFSFLRPEKEFMDLIKAEDEAFKATNNWDLRYQLSLWRGNIGKVIEEHVETGQVDEFLISLAPFVSPTKWQLACEAYSKVLVEKKCYRKAATYLLAVHKVCEAIDLLISVNFYLEAICIARCRFPEGSATFLNVVRKYADWLTETGNLLKASECYLYLNDYAEAVRVLAKKNQPEHLSLAALASQKGGLAGLEAEYSYRALVLCLETDKLELAYRLCRDHRSVQKLSPLFQTHQVLCKLDSDELHIKEDLITYLKELIGLEADPDLYTSLQYTSDGNNVYYSKKSMYVTLAHEFCLACCATDRGIVLTHIIKAMNATSKYVQKEKEKEKLEVPVVYKLTSWLCPEGVTDCLSGDSIFAWGDENDRPKITSLRAYFCLAVIQLMRNFLDRQISPIDRVDEYIALAGKLMNDALNRETFTYFKNQIEIKSIERIINEAHKRRMEQRMRYNCDQLGEEGERFNIPYPGSNFGEVSRDQVNEISDDDIIVWGSGKMNQLKANLKKFEESRITAPNPAVVYCTLREVLETIKEISMLTRVERRWEELQKE